MSSRSLHSPTDAPSVLTPVGPRDRRGHSLRWALSLLTLFGVVACGESEGPRGPSPATTSSPDPSGEGAPEPANDLTSGNTALRNLSSRIGGLRSAVMAQPTAAALRGDLVGNLLARVQFVGSFADLGESLALAAEGRSSSSDSEQAIETEASALGAVHEFTRAIQLLESIETTMRYAHLAPTAKEDAIRTLSGEGEETNQKQRYLTGKVG